MDQTPSLYEAIGGHPALIAAVDIFYRRVIADPELGRFFAEVPMQRLKGHQAAFLALALNGPSAYRGRSMRAAHAGLSITNVHFDRTAVHLAETLAELNVPRSLIDQIIFHIAQLRPEIVAQQDVTTAGAVA